MTNSYKHRICLGIAIPLSVQALPRTPPASFHHLGDLISLQALKDFGKEFDVPCDEIDQACNLASGPADIVVILQRPKLRTSHDYRYPFPQFSHIPDERCHQLLADIIRAKHPKVVIRCHTDGYNDPWMKQFELPSNKYQFARKEIQAGGIHKTTILQSFHPSIAVNYAARKPQYRCHLIYHFIAAFGELSGVSQLHEEAEVIRKMCENGSTGNDQQLSTWEAPFYLKQALERRCGGPRRGYPINYPKSSESERLRTEAKILSTMYDWLEHLAGKSDTFGALGIAKAVLYLWKEYFETNPLYEQVTTLLLSRGSEQQGWFPLANHSLPITEELSKLQISSSEIPSWTTTVSRSPEIFEVSKQAVECISNTLALEEGQTIGKTHPVHISCQAACSLIDMQYSLVDEYLRKSPLTQLSRALKIQKLVTRCTILAKIVKAEKYYLDEPKEKKDEDLTLLRFYLQHLISA